jgi:DNA mismatch endonuclease (patch repair protein)
MDVHDKRTRSFNMSRICAANTKPELRLRRELSARGVRGYRLKTHLPGKPDLVFGPAKVAVFIDGCFWHGCPECGDGHVPKSNLVYWVKKISGNRERDLARTAELRRGGWLVLRFWEHRVLKDTASCARRIEAAVKRRRRRGRPPSRPLD